MFSSKPSKFFCSSSINIAKFFSFSIVSSSTIVAATSLYVSAIVDIVSDTLFNLYIVSLLSSSLATGPAFRNFSFPNRSSISIFIFCGTSSKPSDAISISLKYIRFPSISSCYIC